MIAFGLCAQAKEFLAVHAHDFEPTFRTDGGSLPAIRMDAWAVWAGRERADRRELSRSPVLETVLDTPFRVRVSRVRPGRVRWWFQTTQ